MVNHLQGRARITGWLTPPVALGASILPLTVLIALNESSWLSWVGLSAACAYAYLGWSSRTGGWSIPTAGGIAVGYGSVLLDLGWAHPIDDPLVLMPLAVAFVASAAVLPGRLGWNVAGDAAPGMLLSGLAIGIVAVDYSRAVGLLDIALVAMAIVLVAAYVVRVHEGWLAAAAVSLVTAGLVAGDYWAPLATFILTLVAGYLADRARGGEAAIPLRALTSVSFAATFALFGSWQHWSTGETIGFTSIAAALLMVAAVVTELRSSLPDRARDWRTAAFSLSQLGALAIVGVAVIGLTDADAAGVVAGVVAFEASAAGVVGTFRRNESLVIGAAVLGAAAVFAGPQVAGLDPG